MQKILPESELELNYFFTNPQWGEDTVNPELQATFKKRIVTAVPKGQVFTHDDGKEYVSDGTVEKPKDLNLWGNFSFLTRDVRLANYDKNDIAYCSYYYDLGGDFLNEGFPEAAAISIRKAATRGEMSQGRGGFLRKMQNTLISLRKEEHTDNTKRSILSGGRPKNEEMY